MRFGRVVQTKGLGSALASEMKRSMAISSSVTDRNTPRLRRLLVSLAKKPSMALSQEAEVGVKWKVQRGCCVSHFRIDARPLRDLGGDLVQLPQRLPRQHDVVPAVT